KTRRKTTASALARVTSRVRPSHLGESPSALRAFIALAAVLSVNRTNTRECPFERQPAAALENIYFVKMAIRPHDSQVVSDCFADNGGERAKELLAGVQKRIPGEYCQGQRFDFVQMTPKERLEHEQQIATRQINCLVGSVVIRHVAAR